METPFSVLVGKTITHIAFNVPRTILWIECEDGSRYKMYHQQDCCEEVWLEDIVGEVDWLIGSPILLAEIVSSSMLPEPPKDRQDNYYASSWTWTFYKLATVFGYVTLRWCGMSNGYYSEDVDFIQYA